MEYFMSIVEYLYRLVDVSLCLSYCLIQAVLRSRLRTSARANDPHIQPTKMPDRTDQINHSTTVSGCRRLFSFICEYLCAIGMA